MRHSDHIQNFRGDEVEQFIDVFGASVEAGGGWQDHGSFCGQVGHLP
jgi:hypothetical protein